MTSRTLLLLRHAKSDWDDPSQADHDRPLNARGRRTAPLVGDTLATRGWLPDLVLVSSAARAQETLAAFAASIPDAEVAVEPGLYLATPGQILEQVRALPDTATAALLVGHNPGIHEAGQLISGAVIDDLPTAALVVLELDGQWATLDPGGARLVDVVLHRA